MAKEFGLTRINKDVLAKAKEIVEKKPEFSSVAHLLEVKINDEYKKLKRSEKTQE